MDFKSLRIAFALLLPLLWVEGVLCSSAHGAEQVDQITLVRAVSNDAIDALRESDPNTLRAKSGDTLVLRLAVSGPYEITIDQARRSSLGNTIIRGTTPSGGTSLMVIGADGSVRGHFERLGEVVQVSSDEDGVVTAWVEGVDAKMLPINDGVIIPTDYRPEEFAEPSIEELRDFMAPEASAASDAAASYARFKTGEATIRVLFYYETTMNAVSTVADYLVEITNTAFKESGVSIALEIAGYKPVALGPPPKVSDVLDLMYAADPPFNNIDGDLSAANADLAATLIGSYNPEDPRGGWATIGGKFSTERVSVTRYRGYESGNSLYKTDLFAHEIGHNLGAMHNREQYANNGLDESRTFSFAFGYLIENVQQTIMSYGSATYGDETSVYLFSNPALTYNGYSTGVSTGRSDSAFVARAFTNNRHVAAGTNEFAYEQIRYESVFSTGLECGTLRRMRIWNEGHNVVSLASRHSVKPDGSIVSGSWSPSYQLEPNRYLEWGFCKPESEANPLGTTYTESFFRYYHPTTGELVEGPRFQWSETYIPQSELRIAYTDGGKPIGNTVRMIPVSDEEDIVFQPDPGFSISEIKSTCEGGAIVGGFRVRATADPCIVEASFSDDRYITVTATAGTGGTISPGTVDVLSGGTTTFEITAESGYEISSVTGCQGSLTGTTYTTGAVTKACTVTATFAERLAQSAEAFIERFYTNILGRPSDQAGLNAWLDVINTQSSAAVARGFLGSAEFLAKNLDDAAFVDILYRTLFDREGDAGGTSYWLGQLAGGKLRDMVIWGFLKAAEFNTLSDSFGVTALNAADESAYGIRAFVERFYTLVLGRQPDQGGFDNWVTALTNGTYAGGDIAKAFFLSAEYLSQNTTDEAFVETAYKAFFGREADSAGKEGWLSVLAQGQSREYVLDGFIGSAEFVALANSYGISASRVASEPARMARDNEAELRASEQAKPIPTLTILGLFILSGLLGLLGLRRLAYR